MDGWAWIRVGAVLGFLAVGLGAFGAHGLDDRLKANGRKPTFDTAAQYHMDHALAMVGAGAIGLSGGSRKAINFAGWAFLFGVILFSGSLYALAISDLRVLGMITPFGGLSFLAGWLALAVAAGSSKATDISRLKRFGGGSGLNHA